MKKSATNILWGLVLILIGLGFMLDNFNIIQFGDLARTYWPIILILIAISELWQGKRTNAFIWALLGVILQLNALGLITGSIWGVIWALLLIWIGLSILRRSYDRGEIEKESKDYISTTSIFSGVSKKVEAKAFKGSSITAIFGGTKLDLSNASIAPEGAVIDALVIFGGAEIIVPKGTPVKIEALAIFGGGEDKRKEIAETNNTNPPIRIQGTVLFGGLEIKE